MKLQVLARQRNPELKFAYLTQVANLRSLLGHNLKKLGESVVVIDETSMDDSNFRRNFGRAPAGVRAQKREMLVGNRRFNTFAALTVKGFLAVHVSEDNGTKELYELWMNAQVIPFLSHFGVDPTNLSVVHLDNARIHESEVVDAAVQAKGALMLRNAPYHFEHSPIEKAFHEVKDWLRRRGHYVNNKTLTLSQCEVYIHEAFSSVSAQNAKQYFRDCGLYPAY